MNASNPDKAHYINRWIWVTSIYAQVLSTTQMLYRKKPASLAKGMPVMVHNIAKKIWEKKRICHSHPEQNAYDVIIIGAIYHRSK